MIYLKKLELVCKKSMEKVQFSDFTYFYGEIGSGKSTIARLIDYCFGGSLVETPAIQSEFVSATLYLVVNQIEVSISRDRNSNQTEVVWGVESEQQQVILPTRKAAGIVIPNTEVENLSDLIYYIAGFKPPKVRRSQTREESGLERLSFRDLYWYCYLDQDEIDSSFFNLEHNAETFKQLKSRNVLRYIIGFHQEQVAELELELEQVRRDRVRSEGAADILEEALLETELSNEMEITHKLNELEKQEKEVETKIKNIRDDLDSQKNHAVDDLRHRAQRLVSEIQSVEETISEIDSAVRNDRQHLHEILSLSTKIKRVSSARAVLNEVEYENCPRCAQPLSSRSAEVCPVCGQNEPDYENAKDDIEETEADIKNRKLELEEIITAQGDQKKRLLRRLRYFEEAKAEIDTSLNVALKQYDSAYLSAALENERILSGLKQEKQNLEKLRVLPQKVDVLRKRVELLVGREHDIREKLKKDREAAEKDTKNVRLLAELFLDCLVRAKLPGFSSEDYVTIKPPHFLPEVISPESGDLTTVSFDTLGSGGKKTLFKCCFALAIHRLAVQIGAVLPTILVIDSPMKNISERENRAQFEGFHQLLYELASGELNSTQFVLIDKEYCPPQESSRFSRKAITRHMKVDDKNEPPLITYYRDHQRENVGQEEGIEERENS
jgi:rubrerythrin